MLNRDPQSSSHRRSALALLLALAPVTACVDVESDDLELLDDEPPEIQLRTAPVESLLGFSGAVVKDLAYNKLTWKTAVFHGASALFSLIVDGGEGAPPQPVDLTEETVDLLVSRFGDRVDQAFVSEDVAAVNSLIGNFRTVYIEGADNAELMLSQQEFAASQLAGQVQAHGLAGSEAFLAVSAFRLLVLREWQRLEQHKEQPNEYVIDQRDDAMATVAAGVLEHANDLNEQMRGYARDDLFAQFPALEEQVLVDDVTWTWVIWRYTRPGAETVSMECHERWSPWEGWEADCHLYVDEVSYWDWSGDRFDHAAMEGLIEELRVDEHEDYVEDGYLALDKSFLISSETLAPWLAFAGSYETLVRHCEDFVGDISCSWSPRVVDPALFTGQCACEGRVIKSSADGAYQCMKLPDSCTLGQFSVDLLSEPTPAGYDVVSCGTPPGAVSIEPTVLVDRDGYYLMAEGGGGEHLSAVASQVGSWEALERIEFDDGDVALRSVNSCQFLQAVDSGGGAVLADQYWARGWERYTPHDVGGGETVYQASSGHFLGIDAAQSDRLVASYWGDAQSQPAEARFTSLGAFETLQENCERQVAHGNWHWSCDVPAVSTPRMFNGDCACDGRILRHYVTGQYRCESLPATCGDVSFEETLGYPPNPAWYEVYVEATR